MPAAKKAGGLSGGLGMPNRMAQTDSVASVNRGVSAKSAAQVLGAAITNGAAKSNGHTNRNGHSNGESSSSAVSLLERAGVAPKFTFEFNSTSSRSDQFATFQVDAPSCDNCGAITVRAGNCYLCHNCGNSMGCS